MEFERIKLDINQYVAIITLNHPEIMNAASVEMLHGLMQAIEYVENKKNGIRCLVMTGEGRCFCAGANLREYDNNSRAIRNASSILETLYHPLLRRIRKLKMPFITAVNGAAVGIGMSIALMGDLIICARSCYFLQAFCHIGLVPDGGSTWILSRVIGKARAMELSLLGERLPAATALQWGLVNRIYDDKDLMNEVKTLACNLANGPTLSLGLIRHLYWESTDNNYEEQLKLEQEFQCIAVNSADFDEGICAFLEKRPAQFKGE
jgi:2-(1,2-epoxy-1,2-dihydrophenyl)acetyl-CoA isomerase